MSGQISGQRSAVSGQPTILAIDPGRDKCGVAVAQTSGRVLHRAIYPRAEVCESVSKLIVEFGVTQIVLGDATTSRRLMQEIKALLPQIPVALVDEKNSTLEARNLYWQFHGRRGWRKFWPLALQTPPQPVDDFAAEVLVRRFLKLS